MKVLHLASFNGNIGDNAHHNGFRSAFENIFGDVEWENLEIRMFYNSWNKERFDNSFADKVNKYDVLVIGGGNFFEVCHDYSETGCTINLSKSVLALINIPIFFNALGFDTKKGTSLENLTKFKAFISNILDKDNTFVSFRNDGSEKNYIESYGSLNEGINIIPDGGFFLELSANPDVNRQLIGVNLACDMIDKRIRGRGYEEFLSELVVVYESLMDKGYQLRFFPHILSDLKIIYDLTSRFQDFHVKYNIEIMPYITGQGREDDFFKSYYECDVVTGMRFHTNVCTYGMGKKVVPLVSYPKIGDLFRSIGEENLLVDVNSPRFVEEYEERLLAMSDIHNYSNDPIVKGLRSEQLDVILSFKRLCAGKNE